MHRPLGVPENLLELLERIEVIVIAAHVSKQRKQVVERVLVVNLSGWAYGLGYPLANLLETPRRECDPDHRNVEEALFYNA